MDRLKIYAIIAVAVIGIAITFFVKSKSKNKVRTDLFKWVIKKRSKQIDQKIAEEKDNSEEMNSRLREIEADLKIIEEKKESTDDVSKMLIRELAETYKGLSN